MNQPIHLQTLLLLIVGLLGASRPAAVEAQVETGDSVKLIVRYGDGVEKHLLQLPWRKGITVLDAMNAAANHPRGIKFEHRGRGSTAFLYQIDDVKNEGNGRNWIFYVNEKKSDRSFGILELQAGDTVLWSFEKYR